MYKGPFFFPPGLTLIFGFVGSPDSRYFSVLFHIVLHFRASCELERLKPSTVVLSRTNKLLSFPGGADFPSYWVSIRDGIVG